MSNNDFFFIARGLATAPFLCYVFLSEKQTKKIDRHHMGPVNYKKFNYTINYD